MSAEQKEQVLRLLGRSLELIERITPGNVTHHAGNIRVMLSGAIDKLKATPQRKPQTKRRAG
jgi:hypothetical protein